MEVKEKGPWETMNIQIHCIDSYDQVPSNLVGYRVLVSFVNSQLNCPIETCQ